MAVLLLTMAGQAAGTALFGTATAGAIGGALAGALAQSLFAKGQTQEGPRLQDLSGTKVATEGVDVPQLYGHCRPSGQFIVADAITEHKHVQESGGKGGPSVTTTTFTYTDTFAVAFGDPRLGGATLLRVLCNRKLTEDYSSGADAASTSSNRMKFYDGTQTTPDPDLEALIGTGNVPAYTGVCYGVYTDLEIGDYGNRPPSVEAEIAIHNTTTNTTTTHTMGASQTFVNHLEWSEVSGTLFATFTNLHVWYEPHSDTILYSDTDANIYWLLISKAGSVGRGDYALRCKQSGTNTLLDIYSLSNNFRLYSSDTVYYTYVNSIPFLETPYYVFLSISGDMKYWEKSTGTDDYVTAPSGYDYTTASVINGVYVSSLDRVVFLLRNTSTTDYAWGVLDLGSLTWLTVVDTSSPSAISAIYSWAMVIDDSDNIWTLVELASSSRPGLIKLDTSGNETAYYDLTDYGAATQPAGSELYYDSSTNSLYFYHYTGINVFDLTDLTLTIYAASGSIWALPRMDDGVVWGGSKNDGGNAVLYKYRIRSITVNSLAVSDVLDDLCGQAGVGASYRDATSVTTTIDGYISTRQGQAYNALRPMLDLAMAYLTNSDWTIKFLPLGASEVMTIDADDLGARQAGTAPVLPLQITEPGIVDLPRKVQLHYVSSDNDLQPALAEAENYAASGKRIITVDYPVVMSDQQAANIAWQMLQVNNSPISYDFSLPRKYMSLDAGDAVILPTTQGNVRVRIIKLDYGVKGIVKFTAIRDSDEDLTVVAKASGAGVVAPTIASSGPAQIIYLDLPLLTDANGDHPGPFLSAFTFGTGFPGVAFYQSADDQNFTNLPPITSEPIVGSVDTVPTSVDFENWDDTNTIRVNLFTDGTLSSTTDANIVNNRANAIAWGQPGRWEIIQFGTATLISAGVYDLSHLLRGRRGSDGNMDSHVSGDMFILLSLTSLVRHTLAVADIGSTRYYKAPLLGSYLADAYSIEETIGSIPLEPYSPINLAAADNGTNWKDKDISWNWRTRLSGVYGGTYSLTDGVLGTLADENSGSIRFLDDVGTVLNTYAVTGTSYTYSDTNLQSDYTSPPFKIHFQVAETASTAGIGVGTWALATDYQLGMTVLNSSGTPYECAPLVKNSSGTSYYVPRRVNNSSGTEYTVI